MILLIVACTQPGAPTPDAPTSASTSACVPFPVPVQELELAPAFPGLAPFTQPIMLTRSGADWYLVQRTGQVLRFSEGDTSAETVLDLGAAVDAVGDAGLSALALDPDFASTGVYYLFYATSTPALLGDGSGDWRARLSRFTLGSSAETALLEVEQPHDGHIHANGDLQFGADGLLYLSLGDGGPQGDGNHHAQDLGALQGKVLRIDVSSGSVTIPPDNPFVDVSGARPEAWAYGLRNPWRFTLATDGTLWVGDVGYTGYDELDVVSAGDNLGWPILEGLACYEADTCDTAGLTAPLVAHDHYAVRSIIAGRHYAGSAIDTLIGHYVYADYQYGQIWAVGSDATPRVVNRDGHAFVSFAEDGEQLLAVDINEGVVYRLVDGAGTPGIDGLPTQLSATGCVDPENPMQKAEEFYAYTVNHPFWSDGADKGRWLALPPDRTLTVEEDGHIDVPRGAVLLKEFEHGGARIETRVLAYRGGGEWTSVSYQWNAEQTDATLVPEGESAVIAEWPSITWTHPTRGMCRECHSRAAGGVLGLELRQLARASIEPRFGDDQLDGLVALGWMDDPPEVLPYPALDDPDATVEARARAFLHVNCSYCHRPHGRGAPSTMDLRYDTAMADTAACDVRPEFGDLTGAGGRIIRPGRPSDSVLLHRVSITGGEAMPPIGRDVVDRDAVEVLEAWITAMAEDCSVP